MNLLVLPEGEVGPRRAADLVLLVTLILDRWELSLKPGDRVACEAHLLDDFSRALLQLPPPQRHDGVASLGCGFGRALEVEVRATLEKRLLGALGPGEDLGKASLTIVLRLALGLDRLMVVLHVKRLKVVFELDVERTLRGRQLDLDRLLAPRYLVDL